MSAVLNPVRDWYIALTLRERVLVGVAGGLIAAIVLVFGMILPLGAAHDAAHVRHEEAVRASGRVLAGLEALENAPPPSGGGPVAQAVAQIADAEGLVLQSNQARGNDSTVVVVPTAAPGSALAFIDLLRRQGIVAEQVTITPSADGSVSVNATVRRAGS
ncbi:type II secretion system protein GspM [Croceicoccus naphthovorans]|uniref:type II secretion system protein GspM n=1 Tax=Croceicoccus naphthovorans TaxID=1348774 RepID=UPI00069FF77D|nr:type II secretion system protein GspM [Croceicoccus naphthovorans]MBB3988894.1 general secretion pathway protein M [Croceicoccus naphthovorans]